MRAWRSRALAAWLTAGASMVAAQSPSDAVVLQLREQGYVEFEVSRTLLGRVRVIALAPNGEQREIVFNPATGEILRDYSEAAEGGAVPWILDRSEGQDEPRMAGDNDAPRPDDGKAGPQAASSPSGDAGEGDGPRPDDDEDGNHGHGNDDDGFDADNPGRGHGNDGSPGSGRGNGNNGNAASGANGNEN